MEKLGKETLQALLLASLASCQITTVVSTERNDAQTIEDEQKTLKKAVPQDSRQDAQIQRAPDPSKGRH
jgi:hypothetical protein